MEPAEITVTPNLNHKHVVCVCVCVCVHTEGCLVHKVQVGVEIDQVGVFFLDDAGDELKQRL